jgi:hypothetical protein
MHARPPPNRYAQEYRKLPTDTQPCSKTGGGYWIGQRKLQEGAPFIATTVYHDQVIHGETTKAQQLDRSKGLTCTLSCYETARARAHSADTGLRKSDKWESTPLGGTHRPTTSLTSLGQPVGYQVGAGRRHERGGQQDCEWVAIPVDWLLGGEIRRAERRSALTAADGVSRHVGCTQTTYGNMVVPNPLIGGLAAAGGTLSPSAPLEQRYQTMPRAMAPGMFGATPSYRADFGADGSDPLDRTAPGERFQTRLATTRDLAEGTTRNTNHPPGYTGHQPASRHHELARAQADGADERINAKNDMALYGLDQFSRTRLPHYTGYKPQAPRNITMTQPAQGATTATTYGLANHSATKFGVPHVDNTYYNNR